ncbi:MAG TPA: TonB-dependent receptor [Chryseosolibacter sp.]|nr:TonB-dependent receptor [Chryseosolibacter sp.]
MKLHLILLLAVAALLPFYTHGQKLTQNIRGTINDQDSQSPLVGATVIVVGSNPFIGTVTDINGHFRIADVPVGRVTLKITFMGYEERTVPNLLITSGKEEIVNVMLVESVNNLEEIIISGDLQKGEVLNEMAVVSAHTFSVEETQRFAGSFDDPARLVSGFAGVQGNAEGNNDIIVRGNSPRGILWRMEGIAIPNPNHFAGEGSTGGPINALSSKMLSNSDFFTGAFAPEYGDATSGVFDMKLKNGNNEQHEYTASLSTLGVDMTTEGPFSSALRASYIANYRYSALDLLDQAGVVDFGGVPRYQDMSFKLALPLNSKHLFSLFGLGGLSGIDTEETDEEDTERIIGKFNGRNKMGVLGFAHTYQINEDMYLRTTLAATGTGNNFKYAIPDETDHFYDIQSGRITKTSGIAATTFNYKINASHKLETGIIVARLAFDMDAHEFDFDEDVLVNELQEKGSSATLQGYASWKYRLTEDLTMVGGLHYLRFTLNNNYSIEPRLSVRWQVSEKQSFHAGVGIHSKLESLSTYLAKRYDDNDTYTQPNKDLELTKAAHVVVGYDNRIAENAHLKLEAYYQRLYDVPIEPSPGLTFR